VAVKLFAVHAKKWDANWVPHVVIKYLLILCTVLLREAEKRVLHGGLMSTTQSQPP
jgi:hypothetical protein